VLRVERSVKLKKKQREGADGDAVRVREEDAEQGARRDQLAQLAAIDQNTDGVSLHKVTAADHQLLAALYYQHGQLLVRRAVYKAQNASHYQQPKAAACEDLLNRTNQETSGAVHQQRLDEGGREPPQSYLHSQ